MLLVLILACFISYGQIPNDGIYTYKIAFAEWNGKSLGASCTVIIKGNNIKIIHNGKGNLSGKKGGIIDKGIIMRHLKTGKYIIGHKLSDMQAMEIGGCSDGPAIIDFKKRICWLC
jgi:hypothetical protein